MIKAFPKIFAIGTDYIKDIFNDPVEVTEKIDGSQFAFGKINGELFMRSRGAMLYQENSQKMFNVAIDYVVSIQDRLQEGVVFYSEYLQKPKHNTLAYNRIPKHHLMLFGAMSISQSFYEDHYKWSDILGIEAVPIVYTGMINSVSDIQKLLDTESVLGGQKIEGVVVKNYFRKFLLGGQPTPIMVGKLVSESFKEVHRDRWGKEETGKSRLNAFYESFRTEARWEKAVQHLNESGTLLNEPKDIGPLIKAVQSDVIEEEKEFIKNFLWSEFKGEVMRNATWGLPEWYKQRLLNRSFE
jgi:hypothetical protein